MYRFGRSELISVASTFLDGVLGFGLSVVLLAGSSGTWSGILAAALLLALSGIVIDIGMWSLPDPESLAAEESPVDMTTLWVLAAMIWLIAAVPACALVAPDYELQGFTANLGAWLIMMVTTGVMTWARRVSTGHW
jgi:hypothetical protein